jgi:hypothetical protein
MKMKTSRITIFNLEQQVNRFRKINIFLDGKYCCAIANGKTHSVVLAPGMHTLEARIDWCGSPLLSFDLEENTAKNFLLNCNYKPRRSAMSKLNALILFGGLLLNMLYFKSAPFIWTVLALSFFCMVIETYKRKGKGLLYYLTIGRKNYLKLENGGMETQNMSAVRLYGNE